MNDSSPKANADHNLLFGVLAWQAGVIRESQLLEAMKTWTFSKQKSLGEILLEQDVVSEGQISQLEQMVALHLQLHNNDAAEALQSISSIPDITNSLQQHLPDEQVQASLGHLGQSPRRAFEREIEATLDATAPHVGAAGEARFRILRPFARGGLGEVFVARDQEVNREVALKEIQPQYANNLESRSRFLLEAEVTGALEHPGIVPVYGLGQYPDGRPYYAMRFIKGDSLKEAIQSFHEDSSFSESDKLLQRRQLLGRFVDVCQAVSYAHSRGVLHRDLKPGNIMLGKYGETMVVDWGLAKLANRDDETDDSAEQSIHPSSGSGVTPTVMGSAVGTPAYMPPEQAVGHLDKVGPTSDVYSLGATLYHILTGTAPFAGSDPVSTLKEVEQGRFQAPRELRSDIPKALEAVCLKAMSLHPSDRYESPQALADDVERFLADEPVTAIQEPAFSRIARWIRKHPTVTASTAAVVLAAVIGLSIFSSVISNKNQVLAALLDQLEDRNRELVAANERESQAKSIAEANEEDARQQSQLAMETLTSVVEDLQQGLAGVPGGGDVRRRLLETSLQKLEQVSTSFIDQTRIDSQTLSALLSMGDVVREIGTDLPSAGSESMAEVQISATDLAQQFYARAMQIADSLVAASPEKLQPKIDLVSCHLSLGEINIFSNNTDEANTHFSNAAAIAEELRKTNARDVIVLTNLALAYERQGKVRLLQGDMEDALDVTTKSIAIREELILLEPEYTLHKADLAASHIDLGDVQLQLGNTPAGFEAYQKGLRATEELLADDPSLAKAQRAASILTERLGDTYIKLGNVEKALQSFQDMLSMRERLVASDPGNLEHQKNLAQAYAKLGTIYVAVRAANPAVESLSKAVEMAEPLASADAKDLKAKRVLLMAQVKLGEAHTLFGDAQDGLNACLEALKIGNAIAAEDPQNPFVQTDLSVVYDNIGFAHKDLGNSTEALEAYNKSLSIRKALVDANPESRQIQRDITVAYNNIGKLHRDIGNTAEALQAFQATMAISKKLAEENRNDGQAQQDLVIDYYNVASMHEANDDYATAAEFYELALQLANQMIAADQYADVMRGNLESLKESISLARLADTALGDWDLLMQAPEEELPALLSLRGAKFSQVGRLEEAAQAANKLCEYDSATSNQLYNAACILALATASIDPAIEDDASEAKQQQRTAWIEQSLAALKRSIEAGFDDFEHIRNDSDLDAIRETPEFQELLPKASLDQPALQDAGD